MTAADLEKKGLCICDVHFSDACFPHPTSRSSSKLLSNAVPTRPHSYSLSLPSAINEDCMPTNDRPSSEALVSEAGEGTSHYSAPERPPVTASGVDLRALREVDVLKEKEVLLVEEVKRLKEKVRYYKNKSDRAEGQLFPEMCLLTVTPRHKAIIDSIQKNSAQSARGRRYSDFDMLIAIGALNVSRKCHDFINSNIMPLPSRQTVQTLTNTIMSKPGICPTILNLLRVKAEKMCEQDRCVSLALDAMAINPSLHYDESSDRLKGFMDIGDGATLPTVADQTLVLSIRGLYHHWKQELGYFHLRHSLKGSSLKQLIIDAVDALTVVGLHVRVLVLDQESTQQMVMRKEFLVSPTEPWLHLDQTTEKIYVVWDVPHLLKNLRNNLKKNDLQTSAGTAQWRDIVKLLHVDSVNGSVGLRLAPKLTLSHIYLSLSKTMSVKLAAQVLSHSVAAALKEYQRQGQLPESALSTAAVVQQINDLFDMMNSISPCQPGWKMAFMAERLEEQLQAFSNMIAFVESWQFVDASGAEANHSPVVSGLLTSMNSLRLLAQDLIENYDFLWFATRRCTQDHLESLFSRVRGKNGYNSHPNVIQVEPAIRSVALENMCFTKLQTNPARNANCEEATEDSLILFNELKGQRALKRKMEFQQVTEPKRRKLAVRPAKTNAENKFVKDCALSPPDACALKYTTGWLIKDYMKCLDCQSFLASSSDRPMFFNDKTFIYSRKDALVCPSKDLMKRVTAWDGIYRKTLLKSPHAPNISTLLAGSFSDVPLPTFCSTHSDLPLSIPRRFAVFRLHSYCKFRNVELRDERVNKKTKLKRLNAI